MARAKTRAESSRGPRDHARPHEELTIDDETFERAAAFFRAAGDVSRLKVLARLATGEWCVSELAKAADVGMSTVSQQLRLLRAERLVKRRREGKHMLYGLADGHIRRLVKAALEHAAHHAH
ncbi:MAG TPA: metalloregulator ArsR/SmtB family transcription factor [Polyangiaceae bacterium]|nr:metalloregulator ArsR/SmtB family transcription factor [Polyangiaceae bacterium]